MMGILASRIIPRSLVSAILRRSTISLSSSAVPHLFDVASQRPLDQLKFPSSCTHGAWVLEPDCLFCKIANRELPADVIFEDDDLLAFNDISPQAPTHVLIIPKTHIASVNNLTEAEINLPGKLVLRARALASEKGIAESGYRLIMNCNSHGGQTVYHLHLHLLGGRQLTSLG
jgi:histidine triad (HIT) family protein